MRTAIFVVVLVAVGLGDAADTYGSELDGVDIDALLADKNRLSALLTCVMENDDSHCNANAKIFKGKMGEIITTDCSKCNEKQYASVSKLFVAITTQHPEVVKDFLQKYDPTGEAVRQYGDKWRKAGVKI